MPAAFSNALRLHLQPAYMFRLVPLLSLLICSHLQETQKEILVYAHEACHVFPGFEDQCEMYVNMYGPLVMGIIQQYLQPDAMCGRLGFCPLPPALP
jgi:hypothetical protein